MLHTTNDVVGERGMWVASRWVRESNFHQGYTLWEVSTAAAVFVAADVPSYCCFVFDLLAVAAAQPSSRLFSSFILLKLSRTVQV